MTKAGQLATFAGGCFWCVEAAFEVLDGVSDVRSGYCGGTDPDPTYEAVCTGETGHAEAVQFTYDPEIVSYRELLEVFFTIHDPTTLNRQGPDVGSQYRSAIFYHDDEQRRQAEEYIETLTAEEAYEDEIVTEVQALETFHEAEASHQDYFAKNPADAYCTIHAQPKVDKVESTFASLTDD